MQTVFWLGVILGALISTVIYLVYNRKPSVGKLLVVKMPGENPYLFLELARDISNLDEGTVVKVSIAHKSS